RYADDHAHAIHHEYAKSHAHTERHADDHPDAEQYADRIQYPAADQHANGDAHPVDYADALADRYPAAACDAGRSAADERRRLEERSGFICHAVSQLVHRCGVMNILRNRTAYIGFNEGLYLRINQQGVGGRQFDISERGCRGVSKPDFTLTAVPAHFPQPGDIT